MARNIFSISLTRQGNPILPLKFLTWFLDMLISEVRSPQVWLLASIIPIIWNCLTNLSGVLLVVDAAQGIQAQTVLLQYAVSLIYSTGSKLLPCA